MRLTSLEQRSDMGVASSKLARFPLTHAAKDRDDGIYDAPPELRIV